ncbi:hypothetical protein ARC20_06785 [Stenotrophomonas panacihumi]|uniref:Uncharacterized protein n=1 Tax=Stenotrophomonas panacihumi TaxID=676599 RepID=A0A0R0AUL0_9GAMM|nr:hypothetical protein [Stenotrophomonas panacihumi]KRG46098.1 hypothetical protein ARC20_06785 [Stenotrophomonas panacihumi]
MSVMTIWPRSWRPLPWLLVAAALLLPACKREPAELPGATAEPAATVRGLAERLRANDLVGYAKAAVTPAQYAQLETAWREGHSRWPLSSVPLGEDVPAMLQYLSAPGAEQRLQRTFDTQIAGQGAGIKQAAHSLGLFGVQYLRNQGDYSPEQRAHYVQLVNALAEWASAAPLAERPHAQAAIPRLVAAARATGLSDPAAMQAAGMEESLRRLGPFLKEFKAVLDSYGLPLDASLDETRVGLVTQDGDQARVHLQYPLGAEQVDTSASLVRIDGHWYLVSIQDEVQAVLHPASPAGAAPAQPPKP